jgi:hypothetical protein
MSERSERFRSSPNRGPWGRVRHALKRMTRLVFAFAFVAAVGGAAWADDTRVRASATVEVLDDKAQIDDVISRLRQQQQQQGRKEEATATPQPSSLKQERPPAPSSATDPSHRAVGPQPKDQRPGSRRDRERSGNPDHTERPHPHRR